MNRIRMGMTASCIFAVALLGMAMQAAPQAKVDLTGTWALTDAPAPEVAAAIAAAAKAQAAAPAQGAPVAPAGRGGRGGPQMLTLKQDGDAITGAVGGGRGPATPVTGTVSGNAVTWTISRRLSDGIARPNTYKGTIDGDTITGTVQEATVDPNQGYSVNFTAKRQASQ